MKKYIQIGLLCLQRLQCSCIYLRFNVKAERKTELCDELMTMVKGGMKEVRKLESKSNMTHPAFH